MLLASKLMRKKLTASDKAMINAIPALYNAVDCVYRMNILGEIDRLVLERALAKAIGMPVQKWQKNFRPRYFYCADTQHEIYCKNPRKCRHMTHT